MIGLNECTVFQVIQTAKIVLQTDKERMREKRREHNFMLNNKITSKESGKQVT